MKYLDREGIFKALPVSWYIQNGRDSKSVAIVIWFRITAQLDNTEWTSWEVYEEHGITGYFYVVKRDGSVNMPTVEQLVWSLGWDGGIKSIAENPPPEKEVQITVKEETYEGRPQFKVGWINPGDYTPGPKGAGDTDVQKLQTQFGSLLRAAATTAAKNPRRPDSLPF